MKSYVILALMSVALNTIAQNRANIWELSYSTDLMYPNCEMRYVDGAMDTNSIFRIMSMFDTNNSICDTAGNLLFYTNGLIIRNKNYDTLQNAVNFNPGGATDSNEPDGLSACQGAVIIPDPGNDERYYVFHESGEYMIVNNTLELQPLHLSYSVVDMILDGGLGGIIDSLKTVDIIEDTLTWGGLTAVKHSNGKDWWVIIHRYYSDKYYKLLVTPDGILGPFQQHIGSQIKYDVGVQASFSPDGSKFCLSNHGGWFDYMNFDRCTGEFSNYVTVYSPDSLGLFGNSFSPNNRFLYVSSRYNLYQYDTWNTDFINSVIHIAAWDSFYQYSFLPVLFFMHQLAPDNKIYSSCWSGVSYLNVINSPDSLGLACDFQPHSYILPTWTFNIPSFPNYDLDSLTGNDTCSAIYTTQDIPSKSNSIFRVAPNPVSNWLNIVYNTQEDALFELFDTYGKRVGAVSLFPYFKNRLLNVSDLPAGVYFGIATQKGKRIWSEKVVIAR